MADWRDQLPEDIQERYRVERALGQGAMGVVLQATDGRTGRRVAIKLVLSTARGGMAERLQREAQALARLRHPNLPQVFAFGHGPRGPWMVMEYVAGRSLDRAEPGEVDPLAVMLPVAEALDAVHGEGLLHRDLKPANILLREDGRVFLADFGLALDTERTRLTRTGFVGTPLYLAPEILREHGEATRASDWYGWGATLHQLLEGRPLVPRDELFELLMGRIEEPWPRPRWTCTDPRSALARLVTRCLAKDPADRPRGLEEIRPVLAAPAGAAEGPDASDHRAGGARSQALRALSSSSSHAAGGRGGPWLAGGLTAAALLGCLLFFAPPGGPSSPPDARPAGPDGTEQAVVTSDGDEDASGPKAPGETDETSLPPDYAERVRTELAAAEGVLLDREGRPVPAEVAAEEDEPLLSRDPIRWRRTLHLLPEVHRFYRWMAAGGRPESLDEALQEELRAVDTRMLVKGLPLPFFPYLHTRPDTEPHALSRSNQARFQGLGSLVFHGWAATAVRVLEAGYRARKRLDARYARDPQGPIRGGRAAGLGGLLGMGDANQYLTGVTRHREYRIQLQEWIAEGLPLLHEGLYAARRALEETPEDAARVGHVAGTLASRLSPFYFSHVSDLTIEEALGRLPESAPGWYLAAEFHRKSTWRLESMGGEIGARVERMEGLWRRAAARGDSPWDRARRAVVLERWLEYRCEVRDWQAVGDFYRDHRQELAEDPARFPPELFRQLLYILIHEGPPPGIGPGDEQEILRLARRCVAGRAPRQGREKLARAIRRMERHRPPPGAPRDG